MSYWQLNYHIVWATKNRLPLIDPNWEGKLHNFIGYKARALGLIPHAINGIHDHIHVVISIPPKYSISSIVAKLKGSSSHFINHSILGEFAFKWQSGYGVVSVSEKSLHFVVKYVQYQKIHHRENSIINQFEQVDDRYVTQQGCV